MDDPGRSQSLLRLSSLQAKANAALAGLFVQGLQPTDSAYQRYLPVARELVAGVADYERQWPGSFVVSEFAQPLVQQLSIYADHLQARGDRPAARRLRAEADALTAELLGPGAAALVHRQRAMEAAADGRFQDALLGLDAARSAFSAQGDDLAAVLTDMQLANVYEWLGDLDRALTVLRGAHARVESRLVDGPPSGRAVLGALGRQLFSILRGKLTREGEDALTLQRIASEVLQTEGRIQRLLGDYDEAERLLTLARPSLAALGLGGVLDFHLAAIAVARGDLQRAERLLRGSAATFEKELVRPRRAALRQVQADVHLARGRHAEALAAAADGLTDQERFPDLDLEWKLQWRRARALTGLGRDEAAVEAFREGAVAADRLRLAPLGYRLDTTFLRDKLPMFESAIDLAVRRGDGPAALWFIEMVKSRALTATISVPRHDRRGASPDEQRFDEVSARIDALAFASYSGAAAVADLRARQELLAEREEVLERLRIADPRWRPLTGPTPVDPEALRERLGGRGHAAVTLHLRGRRVVAALVDGSGITVAATEMDPSVHDALRQYVDNLGRGKPDRFAFDFSAENEVELSDVVPAGLVERLTGHPVVVVVPHGPLHLLPWATMSVGGRRLLEHTAVGILPNLGSLPFLDGDPPGHPGVALIGDAVYLSDRYKPLPQSGPEIADLASSYGDRVIAPPATRDDATASAFWALTEHRDAPHAVLHYSGHGVLETAEPLASGLLLTDSTVDAAELVTRPCPFPEVVLSACSTGWRPQSARGLDLAGDDALGLPASFLESGARTLLVSIPPVGDDAARTFSVSWHRHRCAGLSPLEAYRATQQEQLSADPAETWRWAGMTLYGCR
jgi:tetratricopeptide (TPR) repeat protein